VPRVWRFQACRHIQFNSDPIIYCRLAQASDLLSRQWKPALRGLGSASPDDRLADSQDPSLRTAAANGFSRGRTRGCLISVKWLIQGLLWESAGSNFDAVLL